MEAIKHWLTLAKQHNLQVINEAATNDLSLCINLLSIPQTNTVATVAVTVTFLKNQKKKNAVPPINFAKIMGVLESIMQEIEGDDGSLEAHFQPVDSSYQWYHMLDCHRIFFIPETTTPDFISSFFKKHRISTIKSQGITGVCIIADTHQYKFNIKF